MTAYVVASLLTVPPLLCGEKGDFRSAQWRSQETAYFAASAGLSQFMLSVNTVTVLPESAGLRMIVSCAEPCLRLRMADLAATRSLSAFFQPAAAN